MRAATAPRQNMRPTTDACLQRALLARLQQVDARREHALHGVGQLDRREPSVACQRPSSCTMQPSSISCRRISSRKNGLPSARSRIARAYASPRSSTSSRCATSSVAASWPSGLEEDGWRRCGGRRPSLGRGRSAPAAPGTRAARAAAPGRRPPRAGRASPGRPSGCRRPRRRAARARRARENSVRQARCSSTRTAGGWSRRELLVAGRRADRERERGGRVRQIGREARRRAPRPARRRRRPCRRRDAGEALQDLGERPDR